MKPLRWLILIVLCTFTSVLFSAQFDPETTKELRAYVNSYPKILEIIIMQPRFRTAKISNRIMDLIEKQNADPDVCPLTQDTPFTPFHFAAFVGDHKLIDFLVLHDANIDNAWGEAGAPIFYALEQGDANTVKKLIENGASVNAVTIGEYGDQALHFAVRMAASGHQPFPLCKKKLS